MSAWFEQLAVDTGVRFPTRSGLRIMTMIRGSTCPA
jgi:hypothetical protein